MAYNVPIGNWSEYVKKEVHEQDTSNYIVGRNGGSDPAYGCYKNFTSTYQCGNGPNKTVSITGDKVEAGGQAVKFDCSAENKICGGFRLTLGDDGNLVLTDSNSSIVWQSNTTSTGLALDEYKASNGKYKRNYLLAGETLKTGEFIGSPSGNCYLMMVGGTTDCTQNGLKLMYHKLNCTYDVNTNNGYGNDDSTNGLYSIERTDISNLGKVGYIDNKKKLHEYPDKMTELGETYSFIGNYDSFGNDIKQFYNTTIQKCQNECNTTSNCGGVVFDNQIGECWIKDTNIFPKGQRIPMSDDRRQLYVRNKSVKNHFSCPNEINSGTASEWELLSVGEKMSMNKLCELGAITEEEQIDIYEKNDELTQMASQMQNKLNTISNENNSIEDSFEENSNKLNTTFNNYEKINNKIKNNNKNLGNMSGMVQDTDLKMTSDNMKYYLWTSLAIMMAIVSIRMTRN